MLSDYLTDRLAAGKYWNAQQGLKHIFTAITLGLITSLIGYLGMLVAPFPGLQQLSLFSAIGFNSRLRHRGVLVSNPGSKTK